MPDQTNHLRSFLEHTDVPCPGCSYNLRGLQTDHCPECRQELTLRVNLAEPKLGPWITGLVGLSCGIGFNGLILSAWLFMSQFSPRGRALPRGVLLGGLLPFIALAVLLAAWIHWGPALRRLRVGRLWMLSLACWLLTIVAWALMIRLN
jgi:hypothetical protein